MGQGVQILLVIFGQNEYGRVCLHSMFWFNPRGSHRAAIAVALLFVQLYKSNHNETYQVAKKGHPDGVPPIIIPDNPDIN